MTSDPRQPWQPALFDLPAPTRRWRRRLWTGLRLVARVLVPLAGAGVGAAIALNLVPYDLRVAGVPLQVSISTFSGHGISGNSSLGSISYPDVDGLPIGVHLTPQDIDLGNLRGLSRNSEAFADRAGTDFDAELPAIKRHFVLAFLLGSLAGAIASEVTRRTVQSLVPTLRRRSFHAMEAKSAPANTAVFLSHAVAGAAVLTLVVGSVGVATYNSNWSRTYQVSGLLADFKAVPGKLTELYTRDTTSADKVRALLRLEDTLTKASEQKTNQETAYKILFISDMHLRDMYAYVGNVARQQGVKLIINTGDESEYGSTFEMTQRYLQSIRHLTAKVPMIWIAGNHDSPQTVRIMRSIPKVIVLGDKTERADGSYQVTGQEVQAFGLRIAGLADPRVFGAKGVAGASDTTKTNPLEVASVQEAGKTFAPDQTIDIGMGHEPVAADELEMVLRARLMASGHTHEQNDPGDLQDSDYINLNEGSTGLGGLDHYDTSPMEFSVMAVAPDCQFTQITRYQLSDPARPSDSRKAQIRTVTFTPQKVDDGRTCTTDKGISDVADWNGAAGKILTQAAG